MRLAVIFVLVLSVCPARVQVSHRLLGNPQWREELLKFHLSYNTLYRKAFGCPDNAMVLEDCKGAAGVIDLKAYDAAAEQVWKVFPAKGAK
jgi:hypothetical protein